MERQRREKWRRWRGGGEGDGGRGEGGIQVKFISEHLPSLMLRCLISGIWSSTLHSYTQLNFATCFSAH